MGVADAVAFMEPYIADKSKWLFVKDVEYLTIFRRDSLVYCLQGRRWGSWSG